MLLNFAEKLKTMKKLLATIAIVLAAFAFANADTPESTPEGVTGAEPNSFSRIGRYKICQSRLCVL